MSKREVKLETIIKWAKDRQVFLITFAFLSFVYFLWWLAFYPGVLSPDSWGQWLQATNFKFNNAHPFIYSFTLALLKRIIDTPAWMGMIQIILTSLVIAWFVSFAVKRGVKKFWLILSILLFAFLPQIGLYNVTLWKDVIYSVMVVWVSLITFRLIAEEEYGKKNLSFFLLALASAFAALLRHNGLIYLVLPVLILLIFKKSYLKKLAASFFTSLFIYVLIAYGGSALFKVTDVKLVEEGFRIKTVGAIFSQDSPNLNAKEKEIFTKVLPEDAWKNSYECTYVNLLYYREMMQKRHYSELVGISSDPDFVSEWHMAVITASLKNPKAIIKDKLCISEYLLGVKKNPYRYPFQDGGDLTAIPFWNQSKFPYLKEKLMDFVFWSDEGKIKNTLFWSAWPGIFVACILGVVALWRRMFATLSYILLLFANTATVIAVSPAVDYRYVYSSYIGMIILPVAFLLEIKLLPVKAKKKAPKTAKALAKP